ncbi:hypothetical protein [Streptomyces boninensis]|uniref:hypothetical protein n=1 Tax=Streptomyces boninensis TaxID=2039455 RepID=UPI003B2280F2
MGFRGFEPTKLTALANQLDGLGRNSGKLHSRLAAVLTTAQANLPSGQPASRDPDLQGLSATWSSYRSSAAAGCRARWPATSTTCSPP